MSATKSTPPPLPIHLRERAGQPAAGPALGGPPAAQPAPSRSRPAVAPTPPPPPRKRAPFDDEDTREVVLSSPLLEWLPRRGRWLLPAAMGVSLILGVAIGVMWSFSRWSGHGGGAVSQPAASHAPASAPSPLDVAPRPPEVAPRPAPTTTAVASAAPSTAASPPPWLAATAPLAPSAPAVSAAPSAGPASPPAAVARTEPAAPASSHGASPASWTEVDISSQPAGAAVGDGESQFGLTPITALLKGKTRLTLRLAGYRPKTVLWAGKSALHVVLDPEAPR